MTTTGWDAHMPSARKMIKLLPVICQLLHVMGDSSCATPTYENWWEAVSLVQGGLTVGVPEAGFDIDFTALPSDVRDALDAESEVCRIWRTTGTCPGRHDDSCRQNHDPQFRAPDVSQAREDTQRIPGSESDQVEAEVDQLCWSWRHQGFCGGRHDGTCELNHPKELRAELGDMRENCEHWLCGGCNRTDYECNFKHDPDTRGTATGERPCYFWTHRGFCTSRHSGECKGTHEEADRCRHGDEREDCEYWLRGGCNRTAYECNFKHDPDTKGTVTAGRRFHF